jgi:hypothetical protein
LRRLRGAAGDAVFFFKREKQKKRERERVEWLPAPAAAIAEDDDSAISLLSLRRVFHAVALLPAPPRR